MFTLSFSTETPAFDRAPGHEIARILAKASEHARIGGTRGRIFDINGRAIGCWQWQKDQTHGESD